MKSISQEDLNHIFLSCVDIWGALKNRSVFITGVTGFFGKWLLESLLFANKKLSLNVRICALSRNPEVFLEKYPFYNRETTITFLKGDVRNFVFPDEKFDFIIHAATDADAKLNTENPLLMIDTITEGTRRVLDFAKGQPLQSFLLTSSGAIYGNQPSDVKNVRENQSFFIDINSSASAYAEGKRLAELFCSTYYQQFQLPIKIARCFAFIGPYLPLNKHFAIANFILNGLNQEDIIIKGDGTAVRSYMYASDLTIWLWHILIRGENNSPYNVGSDRCITIEETAIAVANNFNNIIHYKVIGQPSSLPTHRYVPNVSKAKEALNLKITIDLNEAITRTKFFHAE